MSDRDEASDNADLPSTTEKSLPTSDLEEALSAELARVLPEEERQEVRQVVHNVTARYAAFRGPLPTPDLLGGYEDVVPGAGERILRMAEKEQEHRHAWEDRSLENERVYSLRGLRLGWLTSLSLALGAVAAAWFGEPVVGTALAAASATGMVWKLVQGRETATTTRDAGKIAGADPSRGALSEDLEDDGDPVPALDRPASKLEERKVGQG